MKVKLLILSALLLALGCQNTEVVQPSSSPAPVVSTTPENRDMVSVVRGWTTVEEAFEHLHPDLKANLNDQTRKEALESLARNLATSKKESEKLSWVEVQTRPSLYYEYPIPPTQAVAQSVKGAPVPPYFEFAEKDGTWYLVVSFQTEGGRVSAREMEMSEDEQRAIAKKVAGELPDDLRAELMQLVEKKQWIAGIRLLRSKNAHSLKVHKFVIEELAGGPLK